MTSGVYSITNSLNGKRYIGKSSNIEQRFINHRYCLNRDDVTKGVNRHLFNAVKKYGIDNFIFEIIEEVEGEDSLTDRELFWIEHYKTLSRDFGYNLRLDSSTRCYVHEETKSLLREVMKGEGNPNYGNKWSDDQKKRNSDIAKKRHADGLYGDSWRDKISKSSSEMWKDSEKKVVMAKKVSKSKRLYTFDQYAKDGLFICSWDSVEDIISANPDYKWQNIYSVCNGYKKSYMGYIWKKKPKK